MLKLLTYLILGFAAIHASRAATTDPGPDPRSGLRFISHDDIKDNRTSLCLTPRSALRLGRDFALEFDVRLAEAQHTFGYVFRMVLDDRVSLDMVSNMEVGNPSVVFTFDNRKIAEFVLRNAAGEPDYDRWMKVVARYHHDSEELEVGVDTLSHRAPIGLGRHSRARIWFGACDHPDHVTTDVPPMDVRDVRVVGATAEPRRWRLGRHDGPTAWDDTRRHPALARNPVWIVDGYAHWHRRIVETLPANYLNMAARADSGVIHFAALDHLATYDNATRKLARDTILNRMPFMLESIQMVYDPQRGRLVTYDVESRTISAMPLGAGAPRLWSETAPQRPIPRYAHHNAAWVGAIDRAVTFGGYGEHTYKSTLNIVAPDGSWESHLPLDSIPPRYLAGMAVDRDGTLIVAGGYGSLSGQQSESPHNFYDIWRIDPRTGRTIPLGEMVRDEAEEHFVVGRDMVLSPDGKTLYALLYSDKRYQSEVTLAGIDLATGTVVRYADAVPYKFSDIESFCTLAFDRVGGELLMVAMQSRGEGETAVEVWTLGYPMMRQEETLQKGPSLVGRWWWAGAFVLALVATGLALLRRRARARRAAAESARRRSSPRPAPSPAEMHKVFREQKRNSSILLLGGFRVIDGQGNDITGHFSKMVKELLLLIMLETYPGGRGITSARLRELLWFDKDTDSARNNRNVNIHRLRALMQKVGGVEVTCDNSYWKVELGENVACDYTSLLQLWNELEREMRDGLGCDKAKAAAFVALAASGKLIPNTQTEWSDEFKAEFTSRLLERLTLLASREETTDDNHALLAIADAMLVHDNLDEDAMRLKCTALVHLGKRHKAQETYMAFEEGFRKALDAAPDFKLEEVMK